MDITSLKRYIYQKDKIELILQEIGCNKIKFHQLKEYYSATQPDGDNESGVIIKNNEYLNYYSYSRDISISDNKDLISLVEDCKHLSFVNTLKYLHKLLGLQYTVSKKRNKQKQIKNKDPLNEGYEILAKYRKKAINVADIPVLDDDIMDNYIPLLYIDWFKEGIMSWTAKKFGLAYSYRKKRVIIPHRQWMTGELVGINARTTIANYDEFGIKKYYITPTYKKSLNLYGLWENREYIEQVKYITIFEAEKSVLKRDTMTDSTGVALSGKSISDEQVRIIIGLKINEIVVALDADAPIEESRYICEKFYGIRKVSYIYDKWGLLGEKDSPADVGNKKYLYLFNHRTKYDEAEHRKYLFQLEQKERRKSKNN